MQVSIPSRGFWFFEDKEMHAVGNGSCRSFQSPRGDFGFLKWDVHSHCSRCIDHWFQSPRGDFGFLKVHGLIYVKGGEHMQVSIPSRGFWFFEDTGRIGVKRWRIRVSIPSRGFWFFEARITTRITWLMDDRFNPLAGILVF